MGSRRRVHQIFKPGDGRLVSSDLLIVQKGEAIELFSNGWNCDLNEKITPYVVFNMPANPECDPPMADIFVQDCGSGCEDVEQRPAFELTKHRRYAKITQPGVYILHRTCGAEEVSVFYKRRKC